MRRYLAIEMDHLVEILRSGRHMCRPYAVFSMILFACGAPPGTSCERFFKPYPDLITGTARTEANAALLDAMAHYAGADFAAAAEGLQGFIDTHPQDADRAYLYLANCYLALGRPYDAELELDFLERWPLKTFRDEIDWYNALCMVCSDQRDRALEQAQRIATSSRHAYCAQAQELVKALGG